MAHKLLAPFKKFPQQLPIFKKSSDKWKEITLSNYNAVYGMLDDVTAQSFDDQLHLLAIGTKRGEIKIYGSAGVIYTLVGSTLKSVTSLKFLSGQGRLLSVTNDKDIQLWEYKVESSIWEITSTFSIGSLIPNASITSIDVSQPLSWKSNDDNLLQLLLIVLGNTTIRQILIIGNHFHVYDGDDLTIDSDVILTGCQDLNKDHELGEIVSLKFNSSNNEKFVVAFSNGLILIMKSNLSEHETTPQEPEVEKDNVEVKTEENKSEEVEKVKEATNYEHVDGNEHQNGEEEKVKDVEEKDAEEKSKVEDATEKTEDEKPKTSDDTQKPEDIKVEVKKIKESTQVPFVSVKIPLIMNYIVNEKKVSSVCWSDNELVVVYHDSNVLDFYQESEDESKIVEPHKVVTLQGEVSHQASNLCSFKSKEDNIFAFVSKTAERPNSLCLVRGNHIDIEFDTTSKIVDYVIVKDQVTDDNLTPHATTLLIVCESQLVAIDLTDEHYQELVCPYLILRTNSRVTSMTAIIQVSATLFPHHSTLHHIFSQWPLHTPLSSQDIGNEDLLSILATGHSDGAINIWKVMTCGVLSLLASVTNKDLFKNIDASPNSIDKTSSPRRQVGHHLISNEDTLLRINNIQLINNLPEGSSNTAGNGLFCVAGNSSGTVFVMKYDRTECGSNLVEITSDLKGCQGKEDVVWNDTEAPELLEISNINKGVPNLSHIIQLNPSLPVTALSFQPQWNMLAVGSTYGFVLIDLKQNQTAFSYSTLARASKTSIPLAPLTVSQQLRKSMRQSFKKLRKLKPTPKHSNTTNDDKLKEKGKEDIKPEEEDKVQKEGEPKTDQEEIIPEKSEIETKEKEETDKCIVVSGEVVEESEPSIEISRKDKPSGTIGSLLIEATNLVSAIKEPCLFAGTNMGAIYAFEVKFNLDGPITVTLSKELHLQHKAPVLLMEIVNSNHVPLTCINEVSPYQRKWSAVEGKTEDINDAPIIENELEVGPSGDSEDQDAKLKAGTLPAPQLSHEEIEKAEVPRKSVDAGKDKAPSANTSMKKSGTLPASFLQAIGKTPGNSEAHELLVVSEEQVKLFSLPSLKAKYKYKVVDTGHHFGHMKTNNIQECEQNNQEKKTENVDSSNADILLAKRQIRRISTVGLCKIQGSKQTSNKWAVAVALTNGEIVALTLNNLKKYLSNLYNANCPFLTRITNGELNLAVSMVNDHNIQITDFSQNGINHFESLKGLLIQETARPVKVEEKCEEVIKPDQNIDEIKSEEVQSEPVITNGHKSEEMNGHAEANEVDEEKDQLGNETVVQNPSTTHHGDITMDSIKEYITNMDGNITVKTFESSTEKHITVNDGLVVTTIHEKQMKDGDVLKDETVKISSDTGSNVTTPN